MPVVAFVLVCLFVPPVDGPVVRSFAPHGAYGGHWGVDLAVPVGTPIHPAAPGTVSYVGRIGGRLSVTIHHGGGVRTSYSYLEAATTTVGAEVTTRSVIGTSGVDHGVAALHVSLRVGSSYRAIRFTGCRVVPADGVRLAGVGPYPRRRAHWHSRGNLRSSTRGPLGRGRGGSSATRTRFGAAHAGRFTVAEGAP